VLVHDLDLELAAGERVALVGRSGAGKTTLLRALMGLSCGRSGLRVSGHLRVGSLEVDLGQVGDVDAARFRGRVLGYVPQAAEQSLDPVRTVAAQLFELDPRTEPAVWLERVELAPEFSSRFPAQLSGGQAQRVALALSLATSPAFVLCDEPWSALDGPSTATVLACFAALRERDVGLLVVTHDLARLGSFDRVLILEDGALVEDNLGSSPLACWQSEAGRLLARAAARDRGFGDG
jgi:ABC-type glutathione transport system ATPase component